MHRKLKLLSASICGAALIALPIQFARAEATSRTVTRSKQIIIPDGDDRFVPFGVTIRAGGSITWVNRDGEDHVIKSVDKFNSVRERKIDKLLASAAANAGQPGTFTLRFSKPGLFVYFCSLHARLDEQNQPVSLMADGSAAMMGVVTVVP